MDSEKEREMRKGGELVKKYFRKTQMREIKEKSIEKYLFG